MTDPTDPNDPSPPAPPSRGPSGGADEAWFRTQVDPMLAAEPADAWPSIEARLDGADALPPAPRGAVPRLWRWVAAAAVIVVVAGLVVVRATSAEDPPSTVISGADDGPGWYIPQGLPEGWTLRTAWIAEDPQPCATVERRWAKETGDPTDTWFTLTYDGCGSLADGGRDIGVPGPALGPNVPRSEVRPEEGLGTGLRVRWEHEGLWTLNAAGPDAVDVAIPFAKAIVADPAHPAMPDDRLVSTSISYHPAIDTGPTLVVNMADPTGDILTYRLAEPGTAPRRDPFSRDEPVAVEGQPQAVLLRSADIASWTGRPDDGPTCCFNDSRYIGRWKGADLDVPTWVRTQDPDLVGASPEEQDAVHRSRLLRMVAALRPATTEEWRAFLSTASAPTSDARVAAAESLATLSRPAPAATTTTSPPSKPARTSTTQAEPAATTTTTVAEPTPGATPGSIVSGPGTFTKRGKTYESFTPIEDLDIRLELASDTIRAGQPVAATLIMRNETDEAIEFNECSRNLSRWSLIPATTPDRDPPEHNIIDCYGNEPNIGPDQTVRFPVDWAGPAGFLAQRRGPGLRWWEYGATLPGGDYLAVMIIPGRTGELRLTIPVTVVDPPCETTDGDVAAYLRHSLEGAKAVAKERGDAIRLASIDGKPEPLLDDLRCDRINIDIDGAVVNAVRY